MDRRLFISEQALESGPHAKAERVASVFGPRFNAWKQALRKRELASELFVVRDARRRHLGSVLAERNVKPDRRARGSGG